MRFKISILLLTALLIRFVSLSQSLWLDEAITANVIHKFGYIAIIKNYSPFDFHPPLFYWLEKFWTSLFGYSEISLRYPSVIFSVLTGYFIFKIVKSLKNNNAGFWAASFFLFNPLIIYYSQEARMYMMTTFLLTLSLYYYLQIIKSQNIKATILYAIFSSFSFLTFYGSIFLILPMLFYLFYKRKFKSFAISGLILFLSFLIISPLLYQQLKNAKELVIAVKNWKNVLGQANIKNLLLIPMKFSIGRISFYPKWLYWFISGVWSIYVCFYIVKAGLRYKLYFYLLLSPLFLGLVFSLFSPLLEYFRFLYLLPLFVLLLTFGTKSLKSRTLILSGFIIFSLIYLLSSNFHREDWKDLAKDIKVTNKPVYMILSSSDPLHYYDSNIKITELRLLSNATYLKSKEVSVIPYTSEIYGYDYQKELMNKNYKKVKAKTYVGDIYFEIWEKK